MGGGRGKKARNFGPPTLRGSTMTHTRPRNKWIGQNWIGQNWFWPNLAKSGWPKRDWPKSVSSFKKGAAGGLSGITVEHLRPFIERPADSELLFSLGQESAEASTPASVVNVLRRGRITALQKPDGGVRGIVVSEVFRRLVARTIAQLTSAVEEATAPFQYALSTRAGCECVAQCRP